MNRVIALTRLGLLRVARRRWVLAAAAAGVAAAVVAVLLAVGDDGVDRSDALRRGTAALLLLGGLAVAVGLGSAALNLDAPTGHMGLLLGSGASRAQVVAGAVIGRVVALGAVLAAWTAVAQIGSVALGLGLDGPLAVHALAVGLGVALALMACAAASAVVGPGAAAAFGLSVYVAAQAAVNLKAAADQGLIGTAEGGARALFYLLPRTITSPMLADLQARDAAGAAAPRVEINDNTVFIPASGWGSVAWTLAWCVLFGLLCAAGLRRRPIS